MAATVLYAHDMAKVAKKRNHVGKQYTWRDDNTGRYHGVVIADPPVRPKGVSVRKIREAVKKSGGGSSVLRKVR
jgi:hypothetical protein